MLLIAAASLAGACGDDGHVDWYAAAGPSSTNEIMPPDGELPTLEERTNLGEWLVCELDKLQQ